MERNIYKIGKELFITSDEEIKEGEEIKGKWLFDKDTNEVFKCLNIIAASNPDRHLFKIILTTDQDLIKDNVQKIDNEFLQWFIKNPSCEEVEVEKICNNCGDIDCNHAICHSQIALKKGVTYKIIIPKEKPKQDLEKDMFDLEQELDIPSNLRFHNSKPKKETIEEAAERYCLINNIPIDQMIIKNDRSCEFETPVTMFIKGAKRQAERIMYSEEEVYKLLNNFNNHTLQLQRLKLGNSFNVKEWFEQFKN